MKLVRRKDRVEHRNSSVCIAYEYHLRDKDINGAVIKLTGRYPDKGRVVNKACKEIVYIISGKGRLNVDGKEVILQEEDQVLIEPGEKYFFEGNMKFIVPCTPAWHPKQHEEVF